jgi:hypothetical protein
MAQELLAEPPTRFGELKSTQVIDHVVLPV